MTSLQARVQDKLKECLGAVKDLPDGLVPDGLLDRLRTAAEAAYVPCATLPVLRGVDAAFGRIRTGRTEDRKTLCMIHVYLRSAMLEVTDEIRILLLRMARKAHGMHAGNALRVDLVTNELGNLAAEDQTGTEGFRRRLGDLEAEVLEIRNGLPGHDFDAAYLVSALNLIQTITTDKEEET